jgi:hypothetical protein
MTSPFALRVKQSSFAEHDHGLNAEGSQYFCFLDGKFGILVKDLLD